MGSCARTPLPELDTIEAAAFWQRYLAATGDAGEPRYTAVACFGDSVELAEELLELVLGGRKRATAGSVADYEADGLPLPNAGERWIACDGRGCPRVVIRTVEIRVGPLSSVDEAFAWDEGEGDRSRADWLRSHTDYFRRLHERLGVPFHDEIAVIFGRFETAYSEPAPR